MASSSLPGTAKIYNLHGAGRSSFLFGLAPGGVCHAASVASRAVRSYRTVSPLPVPFGFALPRAIGGLFSAALSVALRRPGVTRHPALRSSDFPRHPARFRNPRRRDSYTPPKLSMPWRGLEPPRRLRHQILSLACLPVSAPGPSHCNAPERTRTSTSLRSQDPESCASTNSATGATTHMHERRVPL